MHFRPNPLATRDNHAEASHGAGWTGSKLPSERGSEEARERAREREHAARQVFRVPTVILNLTLNPANHEFAARAVLLHPRDHRAPARRRAPPPTPSGAAPLPSIDAVDQKVPGRAVVLEVTFELKVAPLPSPATLARCGW